MQQDNKQIARLLRKYNSDISYDKAQRILEGTTRDEIRAWGNHPCTLSLLASLDGDITDLVSGWLQGTFTETSSTDGTAQLQSKARGMAQAYNNVLSRILDIEELKEEEQSAS